jgi:hypothetical protein
MSERKRIKQATSLRDRVVSFAKEAKAKADLLPPGREREDMMKKARQADTASHLDKWSNSMGLQPPK